MKYHPDRNKDDKDAEKKFKDINEAYDILSDSSKRAEYDQMRKFGHHFHTGFNNNFNIDINDLFGQIFGDQNPFKNHSPQRNKDLIFNLNISLDDAFTGKQVPLNFKDSAGNNINVIISIPAGIEDGDQMRYSGHGDRKYQNLPAGDLYINVHVAAHSQFTRSGPHLHTTATIDALDAIIGSTIDIQCIDNSIVNVKIRAGIQPDTVLNVKNNGMPMRATNAQRGDMFVAIKIKIPTNLPEDLIDAITAYKSK
jgi:curved DNA-binding protein